MGLWKIKFKFNRDKRIFHINLNIISPMKNTRLPKESSTECPILVQQVSNRVSILWKEQITKTLWAISYDTTMQLTSNNFNSTCAWGEKDRRKHFTVYKLRSDLCSYVGCSCSTQNFRLERDLSPELWDIGAVIFRLRCYPNSRHEINFFPEATWLLIYSKL